MKAAADIAALGYADIKDRHSASAAAGALGLGEHDAGADPGKIPPRAWLLGNQFCRGFVSSVIGAGGVGKSALRLAQYLSLATGRKLTGEHVHKRCRVLLISLEDDGDELLRRIEAALLHHRISRREIAGWLFYATPKGKKLAEMRDGLPVTGSLEAALRATINPRGIDLVALDPFVKTHTLEENSNTALDFVVDLLARLATDFNISVDVPHHIRKGPASPGDADPSRGGSAFKDGARLVYSLVPMTPAEATTLGISDADRRALIRLDSAKVNLAPAMAARWFKLVGVRLGNSTLDYPNGDEVQTVEPWEPPDMWRMISTHRAGEILDKIDAGLPNGQRFSAVAQVKDHRAAWRVVHQAIPELTEAQCRNAIAAWMKSGALESRPYRDPCLRKEKPGLFVNPEKRPTT